MITINDLIEHLQNNFDGDTKIAYRLWVAGDIFWALQENECYNTTPADADFDTFADTHPMEYYIFNKVIAPNMLDFVDRNMDSDYSDIANYLDELEYDEDFNRWIEEARNEYLVIQEFGESAETDVMLTLMKGAK